MGVVNCCASDLSRSERSMTMDSSNNLTLDAYSHFSTIILPVLKEQFRNSKAPNNTPYKMHLSLNDFDILRQLGAGASGKILLVKRKTSKKYYAMKVLSKDLVSSTSQLEYTFNELQILKRGKSPFIVNLRYSFQDERSLYFVMDFLRGGDLFYHIRNQGPFPESMAVFYAAEIILGLHYLHKKSYIYRDLKPENILFDETGHIKLIDFGLAKRLENEKLCKTIIGTPEYVAPEILMGIEYDYSVDYWSLGCVLYEMLFGKALFYGNSVDQTLKNVFDKPIDFPKDGPRVSKDAKELLLALLERNPNRRIKKDDLKAHKFFKNIDWQNINQRDMKAPLELVFEHDLDLRYFEGGMPLSNETTFIEENSLSQNVYDHFLNFSYRNKEESGLNSLNFDGIYLS